MKDAMPISVSRGGQAIAADELAQEQEIAVCILLGAKDASEDFTRGIVDGRKKDEARAAILEPRMITTVHLDEEPSLRHTFTPAAMLGRSSGAWTSDACLPQHALHSGTGQDEDLSSYGFGEAARGGPSTVAMGECRRAVVADLRQQATEVTEREAQEAGCVRHHEAPFDDLDQDMGSLLLSLAQGDSPPVHAPRMTESLIC
jgi:hypothetical protein